MKKTITLILLFVAISSMFAIEFYGEFRTRHAWTNNSLHYAEDWEENIIFDGNQRGAENFADTRLKLGALLAPFDHFEIRFGMYIGTYIWGDDATTGMFVENAMIRTDYLYATYTAIPQTAISFGLVPWYDRNSLVLDENIAGVFVNFTCPDGRLNVEAGLAVLTNDYTEHFYYPELLSEGSDDTLVFLGLDFNEFIGVQSIMRTFKPSLISHLDRYYAYWVMPYVNYANDFVNVDFTFAWNYSSSKYFDDSKITNNGIALVLDVEFDTDFGQPGLNVLYTTGEDGEDSDKTNYFVPISSDYHNGLELFGKGVHDESPRNSFEFDPYNEGYGILSIVGRYHYPFCERITGKFAAGWVQSNVESIYTEEKAMGLEFNLGVQYKLFDNAYLNIIGALGMPGKFFGEDLDNIFGVHTKIEVNF